MGSTYLTRTSSLCVMAALLIGMKFESSSAFDCSNVIRIEAEGLANYLVNVTFLAPVDVQNEEWTLEMETHVEFTSLGAWDMWSSSKYEEGKATFKSRDQNVTIAKGDPVTFRFRLSWFVGEPRPNIISLVWEGEQLCSPGTIPVEDLKAMMRRRRRQNDYRYGGSYRRQRVNQG